MTIPRLLLVVVPGAAIAGLIFYITTLGPWLLANQPYTTLEDPIVFSHRAHVQVANMDCLFCHRTADEAPSAGYPAVQQCATCHVVIGVGREEIDKVRQAWIDQQSVDWARTHIMPDHVQFNHGAHVRAGISCQVCHGDVGAMAATVERVRPMNMGDCMTCHRQNDAPVECATCHY